MAALARVGVADQAGQRACTLSGGQQQRAAIARALVQEAEVILADEPVASLDPVAARRVMDLLAELNRERRPDRRGHPAPGRLRLALLPARGGAEGGPGGVRRSERRAWIAERLVEIYGAEIEDAYVEGPAAMKRWAPAIGLALRRCWRWPAAGPTTARRSSSVLSSPEQQGTMGRRWQPVLDDLQKKTGLKVEAYYASNYTAVIEAMRFNQVQVGWFSALPTLEAIRRANGEILGGSPTRAGRTTTSRC